MMIERAKGVIREVTLELVYEVVDERTKEILEKIEKVERKQEEDFRYLNQRIDNLNEKINNQVGQEVSQVNARIDTVIHLIFLESKLDGGKERWKT